MQIIKIRFDKETMLALTHFIGLLGIVIAIGTEHLLGIAGVAFFTYFTLWYFGKYWR